MGKLDATQIVGALKSLNAELEKLQVSFGFLREALVIQKLKEDAPNGAAYKLASALSAKAEALLAELNSQVVDVLKDGTEWDNDIV